MTMTTLLLLLVAAGGAVAIASVVFDRYITGDSASAYLASLEDPDDVHDEFAKRLRQPFAQRAAAGLRNSTGPMLRRITPAGALDKARRDLQLAGLSEIVAPEELVTLQVVGGGLGLVLALAYLATGPKPGVGLLALVFLTVVGVLVPSVIVKRKATARSTSIFKDLPDVLDLLAISVEAGVGFEAALDVVCTNFDSPLAYEFRRTLQEMELGAGRREALVNLRNRTDVPELSMFIMALTQADALGMPIGRVLHTQAIEMRNRRRQWARERAAKLPVKIMFPLVLFIFPAILVVVLFPAAGGIAKALS